MRDEGVGIPAVVTAVLAWLALAVVLGAVGTFRGLRPPAPQLILAGLTAMTLLATAWLAPLRRWAASVDVRSIVALHLTRILAGGWFLVLYGRGELPWAFAVPGGVGDIIVGVLAIGLLAGVSPQTATGRWAYAVWNVLGLVDILGVVTTAVRIATRDPDAMAALLVLPLSTLPTWLVPLIIASHVVLAIRLARPAGRAAR